MAAGRQSLLLTACVCIGIIYLVGDFITKYVAYDGRRVTQPALYKYIIDSSTKENRTTHNEPAVAVSTTTSTDTTDDPDVTICSNQVRLDHIREMCTEHNWANDLQQHGQKMIVVDKYKLMYCEIPKSGSSSMRTLLGKLVMPADYRYYGPTYFEDTGFRRLNSLSLAADDIVVKDYFKMVVVRHPLDRLRSAYDDKVATDSSALSKHYQLTKKYLIEKGQVKDETFRAHKDRLTMEQFFEMLYMNSDIFHNMHWNSYWDLCNPCGITYDLVLKLETIDEDIRGLYDYLRSQNSSVLLPEIPHVRIRSMDMNKLSKIRNLTSDFAPGIINGVAKLYERDFIWAGYDWDRKQGAVCREGDKGCC